MKLRIRGDSIRLRLTQAEVLALADASLVEETVSFGNARLTYAITATLAPGAPLAARLVDNRIEVMVAGDTARAWAANDVVGLEGTQQTEADRSLRILVEKDFACLKVRSGEDDADAFPNPNASD
jgi:hypothetical protein